MPVWLRDPGAWVAIGVSLLFLVAAFVMHRVFLRVLKGEAACDPSDHSQPKEPAREPASHD